MMLFFRLWTKSIVLFISGLCLLLCGCSSLPPSAQKKTFSSASPIWFDQIRKVKDIQGTGYFIPPEDPKEPYPVLILLHTSLGIGATERHFVKTAHAKDYAVFIVDSFTPRGVHKVQDNQAEVSEVAILSDLFSAYEYLQTQDGIRKDKIAVVGFSKGGLPAIYSSFKKVKKKFRTKASFAAHVAFHPWCGLQLRSLKTTRAPVQIHSSALDTVTPPELCQDMVKAMKKANPRADIEMHVYEEARHAFDHPVLWSLPKLQVTYAVPKQCRLQENKNGKFTELSQNIQVNSDTFEEVILGCSEKGSWVSGNKEAAELAYERTFSFLDKYLKEE